MSYRDEYRPDPSTADRFERGARLLIVGAFAFVAVAIIVWGLVTLF